MEARHVVLRFVEARNAHDFESDILASSGVRRVGATQRVCRCAG